MNSTAFNIFRQVGLLLFTPQCFDNYIIDLNFYDVPCFKSTLSQGLSLGLILGSILVKVPQILKILQNKSGEGINLYSVTLDLTAMVIHIAYNFINKFPFSSWGDTFFVAIQTAVIAFLVLWYNGAKSQSLLYILAVLGVCYVLMGGLTSISVLWSLTSVNIFIVVTGKLLQAWTNYNNGHTGQLSAATLILLLAGSLARIFTSIQQTGDTLVILTFIASTAVNALLVYQLIYYWDKTVKTKSD